MNFTKLLDKLKQEEYSKREHGDRFERLIQLYLKTDPKYAPIFESVWMWSEFPFKKSLGVSTDTGIDLVAFTKDKEYWAIQCKFYGSDKVISKLDLDKFLSASGRGFYDEDGNEERFSNRLFISTTDKWSSTAEETIKNQYPPVQRISLFDLQDAPVDWKKLDKGLFGEISRTEKYTLRPHQKDVSDKTLSYFANHDRGKLIMACGTGKTFASLRIAEQMTNNNGFILFLVPSIALLGQTLNEWTQHAIEPINSVLICSDPKISKKTKKDSDDSFTSTVDLALPASTDISTIKQRIISSRHKKKAGMTVVFSTYQSIEVLLEVQRALTNLDKDKYAFDLVICDEAHRTTGVTLSGEDESYFVRVHDDALLKTNKRLYMTATPRLFSEESKTKAAEHDAVLASMDDEEIYGEEITRIGFGEAVEKDLLTDYKVLILTMSESDVPLALQKMITNEEFEISDADDLAKLIGSINALSKQVLGDDGVLKSVDPNPMKRAVAFTNTIKNSNAITETFNKASVEYIDNLPEDKKTEIVRVNSKHIDGSMSAIQRNKLMSWLKSDEDFEDNECRVLTNVRCLSEGVDVPSLDAVMFLSARNSQVDVVQSVGRVMRKAPNKKYGYIIIPVVIPSDVDPNIALDNNERYKVVWTVLNALRAHDDRFNATINKIELNKKKPNKILVGTPSYEFDEEGNARKVEETGKKWDSVQQMQLQFNEVQQAIYAKMVKKVGERFYWEQWAKDVGDIAKKHIEEINRNIDLDDEFSKEFNQFLAEVKSTINPSVDKQQVVEMLAQHIITKPVFEALFDDYSFVNNNPISKSMQSILKVFNKDKSVKNDDSLEAFYESVKKRAQGIDNAEAKQRIVIELYDKFFKTAFPKLVEQLGIVYTPVEIVDFMINSVNDILLEEFNENISNENVNILDPFTGTGTFITRIIQSGIFDKNSLTRKYKKELFANEIVLLAYYIASINIESAFHDIVEVKEHVPFNGIVLTDTFQINEESNSTRLNLSVFEDNNVRADMQKKLPIKIIIGNPPYSIGQKSFNDNAQNQKYPKLEKKIANTYVKFSSAHNKNALYDSYVKAFRWATDRLGNNNGIISFVTNGSWIDGAATSGLRESFRREFNKIYVLNLRGNQRTSGEMSRKEGGKIFGSGSRAPITVTLLVRNDRKTDCEIYYYDIGDYLSREDKLKTVKEFISIKHINWERLRPDKNLDWINKRNPVFEKLVPLGDKKNKMCKSVFANSYSRGIGTSRDLWVYNFSEKKLKSNVDIMVDYYNVLVDKYVSDFYQEDKSNLFASNPKKISWTSDLRKSLLNGMKYDSTDYRIDDVCYRPFFKQKCFIDRFFIYEYSYVASKHFPSNDIKNRVICVSGKGSKKDFSVLMSDKIVDLNLLSAGTQCFPLYTYELPNKSKQFSLFEKEDFTKASGLSYFFIKKVNQLYDADYNYEDIFYYVYGVLHSKEYRKMFSQDLKSGLPRIPVTGNKDSFDKVIEIGKKLGDLHVNYETCPKSEDVDILFSKDHDFKINKMRYESKSKKSIIYNSTIKIVNIPDYVQEYVVNGQSALDWIVERYQLTKDKESGIINNPNDLLVEKCNPSYILDLILRIINLSKETVDLVSEIPKNCFVFDKD